MSGSPQMRNIAQKVDTLRIATAEALVKMQPATVQLLREDRAPKGDPRPMARAAAIMAAKKTSDLIPYCHPLLVDAVSVEFELGDDSLRIEVVVTAVAKTGVEMEALTGASLAALTIYDMLKPVDKDLEISGCRLVDKKGGKSSYPSGAPAGLRAAVVIVSDTTAAGTRIDSSGKIIEEKLQEYGVAEVAMVTLPDEAEQISAKLVELCDSGFRLILTTGGTGLGPRDVTGQATQAVLDSEIPGISEAIRKYGQDRTPYAMLSRGVAGTRGKTLVINLPGSPGGVRDGLAAIFPAAFHGFSIMDGGGH